MPGTQTGEPPSAQLRAEPIDGSIQRTHPAVVQTWLIVLSAALFLYGFTAQRSVSWQDSGDYQLRAIDGVIQSGDGLATDHPLYVLLGHILSLANPRILPRLLNFFSGVGTAVALANLAALLLLITRRRWIAVLTAGMLAVCHTVWWFSTVAEVYSWVIAGLTAELWLLYLLLRRPHWKYAALLAFTNGLGLCIHDFALLPLPVYALVTVFLVWQRRLPRWTLMVAAVAWVLGGGFYLGLAVEIGIRAGSLGAAVRSALFGKGGSGLVVGMAKPDLTLLKVNLGLISMNFINVLLPLALVGWLNFRSALGRPGALAFGSITLIHIIFVSRYFVADQFSFLLPTLVMIAFSAGIGLMFLAARGGLWKRRLPVLCCISLISQPLFFALSPAMVQRMGFNTSRSRPLRYRDEVRYWLIPWKQNEDSAYRWAVETLEWTSLRNGILLADSTTTNALLFVQRFWNVGRNVIVVSRGCGLPRFFTDPDGFRRAAGNRPVYVLSDSPAYLRARFAALMDLARVEKNEGDLLYHLSWLTPGAPAAVPTRVPASEN